ncbi:MAG: hypothetical protein FRX49_09926 [Trebouxia sp. A1-2]|nr:MAG: hypothetical protein FRX49_09926 [Trebouxia sp. A1-2]
MSQQQKVVYLPGCGKALLCLVSIVAPDTQGSISSTSKQQAILHLIQLMQEAILQAEKAADWQRDHTCDMKAVDDSGVAVVVHSHRAAAIYGGDQGPEGVQQQGHSAASFTVNAERRSPAGRSAGWTALSPSCEKPSWWGQGDESIRSGIGAVQKDLVQDVCCEVIA